LFDVCEKIICVLIAMMKTNFSLLCWVFRYFSPWASTWIDQSFDFSLFFS
jgi:hypothetical protein